jgi:hypothetical protein
MPAYAVDRLVGVSAQERGQRFPGVEVFNHAWDRPDALTSIGTIPEERCRRVNLGYLDPRAIDPDEWVDREDEGLLVVRNAGEMLYRAADLLGEDPPVASRVRTGAY